MLKKLSAQDLTQIALSTAFLAIASLVVIPIGMVPVTLQVVLFLLIPAVLGPVKSMLVIGLYTLAGLIGLPVFAGGAGGIGQLFSPSFGYVLGAVPMSFFIGVMVKRTESKLQTSLVMMAGVFILYFIGIAYQYVLLNKILDTPITLIALLKTNLMIFLPIDSLKVLAAVGLYERLKKLSFYKRINDY